MNPLSPIKRVRPARCGNAWLKAAVGLWFLGHYTAANEICEDIFEPLPTTTYKAWSDTTPSFMATTVNNFLNVVQPNDFPTSLLNKVLKAYNKEANLMNLLTGDEHRDLRNDVVSHIMGFVVCAVLGLLFILGMPIVGSVLACCRSADKCGGKLYQKQTPTILTQRRNLIWGTAILTIFLFAGNMCMFRSNGEFTVNLGKFSGKVNNTLDNLKGFVNNVLEVKSLSEQIKDIKIANIIDGDKLVKKVFGNQDLEKETTDVKADVVTLKDTKKELEANMKTVEDDLDRIEKYVTIPSLKDGLVKMKKDITESKDELSKTDDKKLDAIIDKLDKTDVGKEMKKVTEKINGIQDTVQTKLDSAQEDISKNIDSLLDNIENIGISGTVDGIKDKIQGYQSNVDLAESFRWPVCLVACFIVLLVVFCNLQALILGHFGLTLRYPQEPTLRSGMANCGGKTLMAGASLSFAFSWLLMLIVTVLFLPGGNLHTLVCAPWRSGELLKVAPFELKEFKISGDNLPDIFSQCRTDKSVWSVLKLSEKYDEIDQQFDISTYEDVLDIGEFEVPQIKIFDEEMDRNLEQLDNIPVDKQIDTKELDNLIRGFNNAGLKKESEDLKTIKNTITTKINPDLVKMSATVKKIKDMVEKLKEAEKSLGKENEEVFKENVKNTVKETMTSLLKCMKFQVTEDMARCGPLAAALDSAESIVCFSLVSSLNAFWFSLGWCVTFFVPSIVLSLKLAKYYRRMKHPDPKESELSHSGVIMVDVGTYSRPSGGQGKNSVSADVGTHSKPAGKEGRNSVSGESGRYSASGEEGSHSRPARQGRNTGPHHKRNIK
ncbi:prominin-2-like isoform X2 [Festucalex cinctus]